PRFEFMALHFAACRARKLCELDKLELPWTFVTGELAPAQIEQIEFGDCGVAACHECHGNFAPSRIRHPHHRSLGDPEVAHQDPLDLCGISILAAALD